MTELLRILIGAFWSWLEGRGQPHPLADLWDLGIEQEP